MQLVGMADQDGRSGILQDVVDLLRLEMPVHRHRIGAEPHRRIGRLDEGDVVAHQYADAVALLDAKLLQTAGNAGGAIGDFGVSSPALIADDAEEELGCFGHFLFRCWRNIAPFLAVMAGLVPAIHVLLAARKTWISGTSGAKTALRAFCPGDDGA